MFFLCADDPFHWLNIAAADPFVPPAMFSPRVAPVYPKAEMRLEKLRPRLSLWSKMSKRAMSALIQSEAFVSATDSFRAGRPFCARYVLIVLQNARSSGSGTGSAAWAATGKA